MRSLDYHVNGIVAFFSTFILSPRAFSLSGFFYFEFMARTNERSLLIIIYSRHWDNSAFHVKAICEDEREIVNYHAGIYIRLISHSLHLFRSLFLPTVFLCALECPFVWVCVFVWMFVHSVSIFPLICVSFFSTSFFSKRRPMRRMHILYEFATVDPMHSIC